MAEVYIALAPGFEDVEAIYPGDILSRGGYKPHYVAVLPEESGSSSLQLVSGTHGTLMACEPFATLELITSDDLLILPGGIPGSDNLAAHTALTNLIIDHNKKKGLIGAICAAPARVLAPLGLLAGLPCICHAAFHEELKAKDPSARLVEDARVVVSGTIVTSKGIGTAQDFGIALLYQLLKKSHGHDQAYEKVKALWANTLQGTEIPNLSVI